MSIAHIVFPLIFIIRWNKVYVIVVRLAWGLETQLQYLNLCPCYIDGTKVK